ncbi:hypothetical protein CEXT_240201 [Caerostris extrusa]|uniref:Uncharacterized protein n=1 Tax=Caerostris extrusa TaxID=172846 RepID=A0AAV4PUC5_CAEEX|nr:hypothetical protein CEXT_240201 [Caerostris extrusa]
MAMVIIIRPELICIHEDATSHNHQVRIIKTTSLMSLGLNVFPIPRHIYQHPTRGRRTFSDGSPIRQTLIKTPTPAKGVGGGGQGNSSLPPPPTATIPSSAVFMKSWGREKLTTQNEQNLSTTTAHTERSLLSPKRGQEEKKQRRR